MIRTSDSPPADSKDSDPPTSFPVVGIGASAGGMVALAAFLEHLPTDNGMAFVVVLHLSPKHESSAGSILQRSTRIPVLQVTEDVEIGPNCIYVISPRQSLRMDDGWLRISTSTRPKGAPIAIDHFFSTLAITHRDRAIGVVLSGTGSDGTVGIGRLKEQGGVTLAQLPDDCEYEDMPRNAIASGCVDFVLPAADIPQKLMDLWSNARTIELPESTSPAAPTAAKNGRSNARAERALRDILQLLATRTGHDFSYYKRATVLRRIERRLQVRMLKDLPSYRDYLRDNAEETSDLLSDMLINVTSFFRDREAFEAIEREVLPGLMRKRQQEEQVRVWVPGCASGEEAYSLAMLLQDEAEQHATPPAFQVFATDIDEAAIAAGRSGIYPSSIVTDVPPTRLRRFFDAENDRYRIKKPLRECVLFAAHNALRDPPFSRLDLVSCRNVLIYLERNVQEKLLEMFHFALRPDGILFLGSSESADSAGPLFEPIDKKHRIYRARTARHRRPPALPVAYGRGESARVVAPVTRQLAQSPAEVHRRALEQYAPPSVIVDGEGNVVHLSDQVGRFLRLAGGTPSHHLVTLVKSALRLELRSALYQAMRTRSSVEARRVRLKRDGQQFYVNMIVRPFNDPDVKADFALVLFEEVEDTMSADQNDDKGSKEDRVLVQLEKELQSTREQLQATIEQSESSDEELMASNEELQAINEELRSTTEELETSKEELQSVNEELITVNVELKSKVDETGKINDDLQNFIASSDIATVFVDVELRIKRYTPRAETIFSMIPTDVGRSLLDIAHRLDYPSLDSELTSVIDSLKSVEREVRSADARVYVARLRPYLTYDRHIGGAVLTFIDITHLREAENERVRVEDKLRSALARSNEFAVLLLDSEGRVTSWNSGAAAIFGYEEAEAIGRSVDMLFLPEDRELGRFQREMDIARASGRADDDGWMLHKDGSRLYCSGVLTAVGTDAAQGFVKILRDVTDREKNENWRDVELSRAQVGRAESEATIVMKDDFLAVVSHELKHPLNLINVNAEIIARDQAMAQAGSSRRAVDIIRRAVRAQGRIIDDLLDLSRLHTGKLALELGPVDLVETARLMVDTFAVDSALTKLDLVFQTEADDLLIYADAARINQVLWNLLTNAVKFTPPGGRIEVHVRTDANEARLDVIDNGQGMDSETLPRIFDMFGQGRARGRHAGMGIGLALVRQIMEFQGGRVEGYSDGAGKGARFTVWTPLLTSARVVIAPDPLIEHRARCIGLRVLVVDDDNYTTEGLRVLLEMEGAIVSTANNGAQALSLLTHAQHSGHPPNIVLSDIGMADMNGYELFAHIRAMPGYEQLPVIALTGFGRADDVKKSRRAGFSAHIGKPVAVNVLLGKIDELCADVKRE